MVPANGNDGNIDDDMEIVVVSDTVRQRRSRTPSTSASIISNENGIKDTKSKVMPDLLPKTFHLAESSTLFSQVNNSQDILVPKSDDECCEPKFSIVEIRESNLMSPKRVVNTYKTDGRESVGKVLNTCSILESVNYLEPCRVETVHIIDATSEPSDTDTTCSTPNLDDRPDSKVLTDDEDSEEYETGEPEPEFTDTMQIATDRITFMENKEIWQKHHDLFKYSERIDISNKIPPKPQRKKLTPTLKEILSSTSDRDSFYGADKEVFDEPLTFSDDDDENDDNNQLGGQSTEKLNRDTVLIKNPKKTNKNSKNSQISIAVCFICKRCMRA